MSDILIVGAGPTGLVLALWLTRQGIKVRIIDKHQNAGETSRAMAVQARTLELYRQLDLAEAVVAAGYPNPAVNLWARGQHKARIELQQAGSELSPYPYVLIYPQDQHERFLIKALAALGVYVERETELLDFVDQGLTGYYSITARLRLPDGSEQSYQTRYLAACDGARSTIRHQLGINFEGGTYKQVFYVADVELGGLQATGEAHISLDHGDFVAVLSYGTHRQFRLIGTVRDQRAENAESLTFADVSHDAISSLGITVNKVNWFSTYHVHHRVADQFKYNNVFLLGDASHIHSPVGGQGMNTGILDAINLAWKLAAVIKNKASEQLLESYETERQAFARTLVNTTDRVFSFITTESKLAELIRTYIAPNTASVAFKSNLIRKLLFQTVSQTMLNYRHSPLSHGKAGHVQGGDRLPWINTEATDNYQSLSHIGWQVHVYGVAQPELRQWCDQQSILLHEFVWQPIYAKAGLSQDAVYLLRPDTYVGFADELQSIEKLSGYLKSLSYELVDTI